MIDSSLQQELRAKFNPDGSEIRKLQLRLLEILCYIDKICTENGIKYWLSSGSCLGAIRHEGFIPWDDDIDIEMTESEFKKFRKALKNQPNQRFILLDHNSDSEYVSQFPKIVDTKKFIIENMHIGYAMKYTKYQGPFVDIFVLAPSNSRNLNKFTGHIQGILLFRLNFITNRFIRLILKRTNYFLLHNILFPIIALIARPFSNGTYRQRQGVRFLAPRHSNDFSRTTLANFEGLKFPVPYDYDSYLHRLFGDYDKLPEYNQIESHIFKMNPNSYI